MTTATEPTPAVPVTEQLRLAVDDLQFMIRLFCGDPERGIHPAVPKLARCLADQLAKLPTSDD